MSLLLLLFDNGYKVTVTLFNFSRYIECSHVTDSSHVLVHQKFFREHFLKQQRDTFSE